MPIDETFSVAIVSKLDTSLQFWIHTFCSNIFFSAAELEIAYTMETKVTLIAGCLLLFASFCDKTAASDKVPKLYDEIGCTEVKEASGVTR